ncbi:MAG: hypothetical protein WBA41_07100 [Rivularia sp. (in: cyanobacteria)]
MTRFTQKDWLFLEPQNVAVLTTTDILLRQWQRFKMQDDDR